MDKAFKVRTVQAYTYADDLTLYLKYVKNDDKKNKKNIKNALECFTKFSKWSGLNINKNKTYVNIFGQEIPEPPYIQELNLKYCKDFTLLDLRFVSS